MALDYTEVVDQENIRKDSMQLNEEEGSTGTPEVGPADGSMDPAAETLIEWSKVPNLAQMIEDKDLLGQIGQRVLEELEVDETSRAVWMERSQDALQVAMQVTETKNYPWANASNLIFPLLTTAALQFNARALPAVIAGRNVVKGIVTGDDRGKLAIGPDGTPLVQQGPQGQIIPVFEVQPGEKRARAERVGGHMSWQLLEEMDNWEEDTDKLLMMIPIVGCVFRKSYYDPEYGYNCSDLVTFNNLVVNYWAKSMDRAPRISEYIELYPREIEEMERSGLFIPYDYGEAASLVDTPEEEQRKGGVTSGGGSDKDEPHVFIEQHRYWDLDGDGYSEPYCITVHKQTGHVARIKARYDEDTVMVRDGKLARIKAIQYYTKYDFLPNPEGGIYGIGFGQLLKSLGDGISTSLNMMIDAAHLQNTSSGFIGRGLSMHSGSVKFKPFEYKVVNAPGSTVRDSVVPMNWPGPSDVLFQLLGLLIDSGKEVASVQDVLTGDSANMVNAQPTTVMALIDQGLKVFTAIYKRVHRAAKSEYDKLYRLNRVYMDEIVEYAEGDEWKQVKREDYEMDSGVAPVSDPTMVSSMQKLARAQFLLGFANDPFFNPIEIRRRALEASDIPEIDQILLNEPPQNPEAMKAEMESQLEQMKLQLQTGELSLKAQESITQRIKDIAQAVHYLAQADKASADIGFEGAKTEMQVLMGSLQMLTGSQQAGQQAGGQPQQPQQPQRPLPGARQAPSGEFFVQNRGGGFMRATRR